MKKWLLALLALAPVQAYALSGQVSSAKEGPMEGVLVSAHPDGGNITVTVVSDAKGHYEVPVGRLPAGKVSLSIRAVGYDLVGPATADAAGTADLSLKSTADLAPQLTNAEWMESLPGERSQKQFLQNCVGCH